MGWQIDYTPKGFDTEIESCYCTFNHQSQLNIKLAHTAPDNVIIGNTEWWVYQSKTYYDTLKNNTDGDTPHPLHLDVNNTIGVIRKPMTAKEFRDYIRDCTNVLTESSLGNAYAKAFYQWVATKPEFSEATPIEENEF